jgi:hypothetical protein
MVKQTAIRDILDGKVNASGHRLYVVRDGTTVFYVGQSVNPVGRIREHLGLDTFGFLGGRSTLGEFITANMPDALSWKVVLYTAADCLVYHRPSANASMVREDDLVSDGEQYLIDLARPCLNVQNNRDPNPIPEHYRRPESW